MEEVRAALANCTKVNEKDETSITCDEGGSRWKWAFGPFAAPATWRPGQPQELVKLLSFAVLNAYPALVFVELQSKVTIFLHLGIREPFKNYLADFFL